MLHKRYEAISKMPSAAKLFLWSKLQKDTQQKCEECILCRMAGKSITAQIRVTEINYLPPDKKPNQEIQLDFTGPIRFKHRRFYLLNSKDRYSRRPAACICETPNGKTAKKLEQYITINGLPQTIRTDESTAFTGKEIEDFMQNPKHQINIRNTVYTHTNRISKKRNKNTQRHFTSKPRRRKKLL